jgi:hypothetical protein
LWGRQCVVVYLSNGGVLRMGTDDAENLARFLEGRTAPQASTDLEHRGGQP